MRHVTTAALLTAIGMVCMAADTGAPTGGAATDITPIPSATTPPTGAPAEKKTRNKVNICLGADGKVFIITDEASVKEYNRLFNLMPLPKRSGAYSHVNGGHGLTNCKVAKGMKPQGLGKACAQMMESLAMLAAEGGEKGTEAQNILNALLAYGAHSADAVKEQMAKAALDKASAGLDDLSPAQLADLEKRVASAKASKTAAVQPIATATPEVKASDKPADKGNKGNKLQSSKVTV